MEQRTFLAIILSAIVLFSYDAFFVAPKRAQQIKETKTVNIKEDTKNTTSATGAITKEESKNQNKAYKENNWEFKTPEFKSDLTNVGGTLHNIKIGLGSKFPLESILTIAGLEQKEFKLIANTEQKTVFQYEDAKQRVTNTIELKDKNSFTFRMEISSLDSSRMEINKIKALSVHAEHLDMQDQRDFSLYEYSYLVDNKVIRKWNATKFVPKENKTQNGNVTWVGFRNHFSAIVIHPEFETKSIEVKTDTEKELGVYLNPKDAGAGVYEFTCYLGPQNTGLMKQYGHKFDKIVAFFGNPVVDTFAKGIYYTIPFIQSIFKSWGISIILISLIIYGLTYPLTIQSMLSMRKMQQVQPKVKALQDRFKNDPQKLNAEIMEIYRREKINPLAGCLPFLLQMPIFIALYQVLWRAYYFQGKSFLWIKDLALPDRAFILPFSLPFLGNEVNILPVAMSAVMFLQQRISAKNMIVTDEQQAMQQKMMQYFFPVFIGFIFYHFASGLSLYFTVFYALSTFTQWNINKNK